MERVFMREDLLRVFEEICNTGVATAGYTSGLCGEWVKERFDPVKKVVAIAHSGWVGTATRIAGKTVKKMVEEYQVRPEDIICAMGPYNHSCCYEVGEDVRERFREAFSDLECDMFFQKKKEEEKYLLDLGAAISFTLQQEGVKTENIHDEGHCTYHTTTFSSWRRTGNKKHQILSYIMLN